MAEGKSGCPVSIHWVSDPICSLNFLKTFFLFLVSCFVEFFVIGLVLVGRLFYLVGGFWIGFLWGVVSPVHKTSEFCISYYQCYQKVSKKTLYGMQWREGWSDSFDTNDTACGQSSIFCRLLPQSSLWIIQNCTAYVFNYLSCFKV